MRHADGRNNDDVRFRIIMYKLSLSVLKTEPCCRLFCFTYRYLSQLDSW